MSLGMVGIVIERICAVDALQPKNDPQMRCGAISAMDDACVFDSCVADVFPDACTIESKRL